MKYSIENHFLCIDGKKTKIFHSEAEEEFWTRIKELEQEVAHWKSNHDNQVKLKNQLMDRPDLKDRAESILKLNKRIEELEKALKQAKV